MYEQIRYVNHLNESLEVGSDNKVYVNENDLHNYSWESITVGDKISGFRRGIVTKTLPLRIIGVDQEEKNEILNNIYQLGEKDILATQSGRLYVGEYYLKCYVSESKKSDYLKKALRYTADEITVTTDHGFWIKETSYTFLRRDDQGGGGDTPIVTTKRNFDYNYDFPYDYLSANGVRRLYNPSFVPSNFRIVMYGPKENPYVKIGANVYRINVSLLGSEYVIIDSIEKTVEKHKFDGTVENCFMLRDRDYYIFQKIAPRENPVIWDGDFRFDVILFDERSEPLWI